MFSEHVDGVAVGVPFCQLVRAIASPHETVRPEVFTEGADEGFHIGVGSGFAAQRVERGGFDMDQREFCETEERLDVSCCGLIAHPDACEVVDDHFGSGISCAHRFDGRE